MVDWVTEPVGNAWDADALAASQAVAQQMGTSEWLGPLAPIALSPFFGLTVLSGAATYGPEWLQQRSALFHEGSALNSPVLFWTMLLLAMFTSLPRLTKVSKPLAMAAENLEACSAIIILVAVRFLSADASGGAEHERLAATTEQSLRLAGIASLPMNFLMSMIAAMHIIVVNVVKAFFEFLVWLTPFPTADAILELANKSLCFGLMTLYAWSPTLATLVSLTLCLSCLVVFGWCYRRLRFYQEIVFGPFLAALYPRWFRQKGNSLRAFSEYALPGLPAYTPLSITRRSDGSCLLQGRWLWRRFHEELDNCSVVDEPGLLAYRIRLQSGHRSYLLAHRRWVKSDDLYRSEFRSNRGALECG